MLTIWLNFLVNIMSKTKDTNTETTILNAAETIFQQKGMTKNIDGFFDVNNVLEKLQAHYITLAVNASFEIADIEFAVGPCVSYAVTGESIVWDFPKNGNVYTRNVSIKEDCPKRPATSQARIISSSH